MKATKGGNFNAVELPEPQTALARCYSVVDFGTVKNIYKGEDKGWVHKIYVTWEFPELLAQFNPEKGEEPFVIGMELTMSTSENSNLAKLISQWRNKPLTAEEQEGFDPSTMVGKCAMISFLHKRKPKFQGQEITKVTNENTNLKFNGIMPKPKALEAPKNRNPYLVWDWEKVEKEGFEKNKETFEKIPKWIQKKISESQEFGKFCKGYKIEGTDNDDEDNQSDTAAPGTGAKGSQKKVSDGDEW